MKYEVKYDPKTEKQLEKLPRDAARRIAEKMREVGNTGSGIESVKNMPYGFKVRVGDSEFWLI